MLRNFLRPIPLVGEAICPKVASLHSGNGLRSLKRGGEAEEEYSRQIHEKSVNSVTLLGRVGVDPQLRGTDQHPVVSFSLATTIHYTPGGVGSGQEPVSKTEWHNVAVFKPKLRQSVYDYVTKGSRVMIQGRIMYGTVEDKDGGSPRPTTTIVAEDVIRFA